MTECTQYAYAKLNLTLDVLNKRPDGYHDLRSIMQQISLHDTICLRLEEDSTWKLTCSDALLPVDSKNLAWKAAEVFCEAADVSIPGLSIHVQKVIPSQAGMAGGSADAAAVLMGLNRMLDFPLSSRQLLLAAQRIGSDVPFCLFGGTAFAQSRGEVLSRLPRLPHCSIVIVKPSVSISTPALFHLIDSFQIDVRPDHDALIRAMERDDVETVAKYMHNVFEPLAQRDHPEIGLIKQQMLSLGACGAQMTGSGSAVFGIWREEEDALCAMRTLQERYEDVFIAYPIENQ